MRLSRRILLAVTDLFGLADCEVATPFDAAGPSASAVSENAIVIVAITEATLSDRNADRKVFWQNVERVEASLEGQSGFLGISRRLEVLGDRAWTMTAWEDEESLRAFVSGQVHQRAIDEANGGLADSRFVRFKVPSNALPVSWDEALAKLESEGRAYWEYLFCPG